MSHSHEPSYYEIALTNRQVLVVFVVLLVCVVAAFFSGVWIGQQDGEPIIAEVAEVLEDEPTADGEDIVTVAQEEPQTQIIDLMDALKASLSEEGSERKPAKAASGKKKAPARKRASS